MEKKGVQEFISTGAIPRTMATAMPLASPVSPGASVGADNNNPVARTVALNKATMRSLFNISNRMAKKTQFHYLLGIQYLRFGHSVLAKDHLKTALDGYSPAADICPQQFQNITETKMNLAYAQSLYDFAASSRVTAPGTGRSRIEAAGGYMGGSKGTAPTGSPGENKHRPQQLRPVVKVEGKSGGMQQTGTQEDVYESGVFVDRPGAPVPEEVIKKAIDDAKSVLMELVSNNSTRAECWNHLGRLLFNENEPAVARMAFEHIINSFPGNDDLDNNLGFLRILTNSLTKAKKNFEYILERNPTHMDALNNYAAILLQDNKFHEARILLGLGLKQNQARKTAKFHTGAQWSIRFTTANYLLNVLRSREKSIDRHDCIKGAQNLLESVLQYEETSDVHVALSKLYQARRQELMRDVFMKRRRLQQRPSSMCSSSSDDEFKEDRAKAEAWGQKREDHLVKAVQMDRLNRHAWNELGLLFLERGVLDKAITYFKEAVYLDRNQCAVWINLGVAYHLAGHLEETKRVLERALQLDPTSVEARNNLANLYKKQGELQKAKNEYIKCLSDLSASLRVHNQGLERTTQAAGIPIRPKEELEYQIAQTHNNLALVFIREGNFKSAMQNLQMAERHAPLTCVKKNREKLNKLIQGESGGGVGTENKNG
eukprot:jgi/Bigna1/125698/aug1.1_g406